jgi:hypothetical protein
LKVKLAKLCVNDIQIITIAKLQGTSSPPPKKKNPLKVFKK